MNFKLLSFLLLALIVGASSCKEQEEDNTDARFGEAIKTYAKIVSASYEDSYNEAVKLRTTINDFVANPSEEKFLACKNQWKKARLPYGQTEAYRFYDGPIDDANGPEGLINAWPMDENYIDYVSTDANTGIINNPSDYPNITKEVLTNLNEAGGEANVATGYHAIEFLLWGQDLYLDSPGRRPYTDYVTGDGGTAANQGRRGTYLKVVADLLVDNLAYVKGEWATNGAYRAKFLAFSKKDAVTKIFNALSELSKGELSGERMNVAVESKDQEDEHSCFADNTHVDIQQNFEGLVNVYTGRYVRTDGTVVSGESFDAIATTLSPTKATAVDNAIIVARQKIYAIPVPFDNAILYNTDVLLETVKSLEDLSDAFADVKVELTK